MRARWHMRRRRRWRPRRGTMRRRPTTAGSGFWGAATPSSCASTGLRRHPHRRARCRVGPAHLDGAAPWDLLVCRDGPRATSPGRHIDAETRASRPCPTKMKLALLGVRFTKSVFRNPPYTTKKKINHIETGAVQLTNILLRCVDTQARAKTLVRTRFT